MIEANERKLCYIRCIIADWIIGMGCRSSGELFVQENGAVRFYKISR